MPVIGRLDDQVNEVLIKPLSGGRAADDPAAPPRPPSPEPEPTGESASRKEAPDDGAQKDGLPVWLL